jgi:hypothetical protein
MEASTNAALNDFMTFAQKVVDDYMRKSFPRHLRVVLRVEHGRRYVKVIRSSDGVSRSVYCFVDMTNGDILKHDTWKKPAKHARGNIRIPESYAAAVDAHGATYLR